MEKRDIAAVQIKEVFFGIFRKFYFISVGLISVFAGICIYLIWSSLSNAEINSAKYEILSLKSYYLSLATDGLDTKIRDDLGLLEQKFRTLNIKYSKNKELDGDEFVRLEIGADFFGDIILSYEYINTISLQLVFSFFLLLFGLFWLNYFSVRQVKKSFRVKILNPLQSLIKYISLEKIEYQEQGGFNEIRSVSEFNELLRGFEQNMSQLFRAKEELSNKRVEQEIIDYSNNLAHDIRSPVSALQTISSSLCKSNVPTDVLSLLNNSISRIKNMSEDLLEVRKKNYLENLDNMKTFSALELVMQLTALIEEFKISNGTSLITLKVSGEIYEERMSIRGSVSKVLRGVSNIVANSIEARKENQKKVNIEVFVSRVVSGIKVVVKDDGDGMSEQVIEKILQNQEFTTKGNGNGIGLSSTFRYVKYLGGEVQVNSKLGVGSSLSIILPLQDFL